jgi:lysophospholipase L1-like esterase
VLNNFETYTSMHLARTMPRLRAAAIAIVFALPLGCGAAMQFTVGAQPALPGHTVLTAASQYSSARGFGFEPGSVPNDGKPFLFSADVPAEGNYKVTVTLGDDRHATRATVKAELRRLMLENVATAPGASLQRSFVVNVRTPEILAGDAIRPGVVALKERERAEKAGAWDRKLTLEFNGTWPSVRTISIEPADVPTLFIIGDSTVCDNPAEPWGSWGQMITRFFTPGIAVANHAESGETYRDALGRRRLDKILSVMRPGDTLLMQFGHNDQKQTANGSGSAATTYKQEIRTFVAGVRRRGGIPVVLSPMERRRFDAQGNVVPTLGDYARAAREVAAELGVAFIDLNAMSLAFHQALGPENSKAAFARPAPGKIDNTHHSNYGSYQLARMVVQGLRDAQVPAAAYLSGDVGAYDPARPEPFAAFALPSSPQHNAERPAGDEGNQ